MSVWQSRVGSLLEVTKELMGRRGRQGCSGRLQGYFLFKKLVEFGEYIVQMTGTRRILYFLGLLGLLLASITGPEGPCLGNCANCDPYTLSKCKGTPACEWGFYDPTANGKCQIIPSLQLDSVEMGQRANQVVSPTPVGWGKEASVATCDYQSFGSKKTVDVLGFFQGTYSMEKSFPVAQGSEIFELSFSLVRSQWLPFHDFMMIEMTVEGGSSQTFQISYVSMGDVNSQFAKVTCNDERVFVEKYRIKLSRTIKGKSVKVIFSSFLFEGYWGLTNIKAISGCGAYAGLDSLTSTCSLCSSGSFYLQASAGFGVCRSCPQLCKTCIAQDACTECSWGNLVGGKCEVSSHYKSQVVDLGSPSTCTGVVMIISQDASELVLPAVENVENSLFNQVAVSMMLYFDASTLDPKTGGQIEIFMHGESVLKTSVEESPIRTEKCSLFWNGQMGHIRVVSQSFHVTDIRAVLSVGFQGVTRFGVGDVKLYSIRKTMAGESQDAGKVVALDGTGSQEAIVATQYPQDTQKGDTSVNSESQSGQANANSQSSQPTTTQAAATVQSDTSSQSAQASPTSNPSASSSSPSSSSSSPSSSASEVLPPQPSSDPSGDGDYRVSAIAPSSNSSGIIDAPISIRFDSNEKPYSQQVSHAMTGDGTLMLSIKNVPVIQGMLVAELDKLTPNDYQLIANYYNDQELIIVLNITKSFTNGTLTVKEVSTGRLLVVGQTQVVARVQVDRFDAYSPGTMSTVASYGGLFCLLAWVGIVAMLLAILTGYGITVEEHIICVQMLYLHVYIGYDVMPVSFREVVANLRTVGFLHFFPEEIAQSEWSLTPEAMYWLAPGNFSFFHAFLPIFASLVVFAVWFLLLAFLKKWLLPRTVPDEGRSIFHKMADNIVCRVVNYVDSIWRYQFISVILICVVQLVALEFTVDAGGLAMVVILLLAGAIWTLISEFHIRNQYYENEYSEFIYKFEDRYFCKIPLHSLPSRHHRLGYPLIRMAKSTLFVLICLLVQHPLLSLLSLLAINGLEFWYLVTNSIYSDRRMFVFKVFQNGCILVLEFLLLLGLLVRGWMGSNVYLYWGYLLSSLVLVIVLATSARAVFIVYFKYDQAKGVNFEEVDIDQRKLQTERAV